MISGEKYEKTENILNRTIEFINSCDTKASIIITLVGILMTALSAIFVGDVVNIKSNDIQLCSKGCIAYFVIAGISMIFMVIVMIMLIIVLFARTKSKRDSKMFFGNISKKELSKYEEEMMSINADELFSDLIQQIHINSIICDRKFRYFNKALVLLLFSIVCIVADIVVRVVCM